MAFIAGIVGSVLIGGAVATATIVGVVHQQTAAPDQSPTSVNAPVIQYGE